jgi:hypothetical protein
VAEVARSAIAKRCWEVKLAARIVAR